MPCWPDSVSCSFQTYYWGNAMAVGTYYLNDPNAPKPNSPTRIGTNVYLQWDGKLLLEKRWDCEMWGLPGGRLNKGESYTHGIAREVWEETGIRLAESAFHQLRIVDDNRIAAYADGTVWKMIIVLFSAKLDAEPQFRCSKESGELRFFTPEELSSITPVPTHKDLILQWKPE